MLGRKSLLAIVVLGALGHHVVVHGYQLPLTPHATPSSWNVPPSADESGHLIFNSASSYLQHWPNTRYRNGHSVVPGYIRPGTLLYHGGHTNSTPTRPDWCSFDFEHSFVFGSFMQTYAVSGPGRGLKVLYFDGSSASNMPSGTIDTQVLLINGELKERGWIDEFNNIHKLCEWAQQYGIGGFIRMEFDFELMLCDFTNGVKPVSNLPLVPTGIDRSRRGDPQGPTPRDVWHNDLIQQIITTHPRLNPPNHPLPQIYGQNISVPTRGPWPPWPSPPVGWKGSIRQYGSVIFEAIQTGNWHNTAPGVSGVDLDYSSAISFFDPKYTSLVVARRKTDQRELYRAGNISRSDMDIVSADLDEVLKRDPGAIGSGIKWADVVRSVKERHSQRLEYLAFTLRQNVTATHNISSTISYARDQTLMTLSPFLINTPIPSSSSGRDAWLAAPIHHCTNTFAGHISEEYLTPQEKLIRHGIQVVMREICRTMGVLWLDAFEAEEVSEEEQRTLVHRWCAEVERLMSWLGWAEWIKCEPACTPTEMCSLPQWPFDMGSIGPGDSRTPEEERKARNNYTPRCMNRLEEYLG